MIKYLKIKIEGFGVIAQPLFYDLSKPGVNLIQGRNGHGKSTIFSALCWVQFGKSLKENADVTPITPKWEAGTKVALDLQANGKNITIVRCKDYKGLVNKTPGKSRLCLWVDGVFQADRDKNDTQRKIEDILGVSLRLYKSSIMFGQKLTRLLQESGPKQKEIFDEAFEVTYINVARSNAAKKYEELNTQLLHAEHEESRLKLIVDNYSETLNRLQDEKEEKENRQKSLKENLEKIRAEETTAKDTESDSKKLRIQAKALEKLQEKQSLLEKVDFKLDMEISNREAEGKAIRSELSSIKMVLSKKVPTCRHCGQEIEEAKRAMYRDYQKESLRELYARKKLNNQQLGELTDKREELTHRLKKIKKKLIAYKDVKSRLSKIENTTALLSHLKTTRLRYEADFKTLEVSLARAQESLKQESIKLKSFKDQLTIKSEEVHKLKKRAELHSWLIKDPLGNSGLKAYIFNSCLTATNKRLRYYAQYIGFRVKLSIDLESAHKNFIAEIYKGDLISPYESLSGGEKQLVDVVLAFSIHETMTQEKEFNLLGMDEIFESLDDKNIELVSQLLELKATNGLGIHIISHQQNLQFTRVAQVIKIVKTNKLGAVIE